MLRRNKGVESKSRKVEILYDKYKNLMYKEAYRILADAGLAEDAIHQSFIKIIRNLDKIDLKDESRTRNFLVIICRNTAIDIYKKRLYLNNNSDSINYEIDDEVDDNMINYVEPSKIVIDRETVNKVAEAIENLPEIYRDVILLEKLYGYTKEEIADLLGVNYETIKKRSIRARKILLKALETEGLK